MAEAQPVASSSGFKLTFKLNGSGSGGTSGSSGAAVSVSAPTATVSTSTAQSLPVVPGPPQPPVASTTLESSPAPSDAASSVIGAAGGGANTPHRADTPAGTSAATDKPAKKRSRKSNVEPGPGKHWRKGLKGNITGGIRATEAPPGVTAGAGVAKRSGAGSTKTVGSLAVAPAPKIAANSYLAIQTFDAKTPAPRKWTAKPREILTVTGMKVELRSWFGDPKSVFAESISSRIFDETKSSLEGVENASAADSRIASPAPAASATATTAAPAKKAKKRPRASAAGEGGAPLKKSAKKKKNDPTAAAEGTSTIEPSRANSVSEQGAKTAAEVESANADESKDNTPLDNAAVPKSEEEDEEGIKKQTSTETESMDVDAAVPSPVV